MTTPDLLPRRLRHRWIGLLGLGGLCVLVVSMAGAAWMLRGNSSSAFGAESASAAGFELREVHCQGYVDVEGGVVYPYPLRPGRVQEIRVHEGDVVHAGDVLFGLDPTLAQAQVHDAGSGVQVAESRLVLARNALPLHKIQLAAQTRARDAMQYKLETAKMAAARKQELAKEGHLNPKEAEIADVQIKECQAGVDAEQKKLEAMQGEMPEELIRQAEQNLKHSQALLTEARYALDECQIKAPSDGSILRLALQKGELLGPDPKIPPVIFCPAGPRIIRAEVEQEWASRVAVGQNAVIRDDCTNDGPEWKGKFQRVADWMAYRVLHPSRSVSILRRTHSGVYYPSRTRSCSGANWPARPHYLAIICAMESAITLDRRRLAFQAFQESLDHLQRDSLETFLGCQSLETFLGCQSLETFLG